LATNDLLSSTIATYFLNDMFGSMVGPLWTWAGIPDRNAVLEHTFETMWNTNRGFALPRHVPSGFLGLRFSPQSDSRAPIDLLPHLMLNGTDLSSGNRMITSTIRWSQERPLFPDSGDFVRLASRDVTATAVTNSALSVYLCRTVRQQADGASYKCRRRLFRELRRTHGVGWARDRGSEREDPSLTSCGVVVISNDLGRPAPARGGRRYRRMLEDGRGWRAGHDPLRRSQPAEQCVRWCKRARR
jgi:hypothetical protein